MNLHEIMYLLNAGYTKQEIENLESIEANVKIANDIKTNPNPKPDPKPASQPDLKQASQQDPKPASQPDPKPASQPDPKPGESPALAGIVKTLESMTKAMQTMNLRLSSVEQPKQETAEDILATIINPTYKKE